jgi:predicted acyl esterase
MSKGGLKAKSVVRDGMRIEVDVPIPIDDGLVLRADVYRPVEDGRYPALLSYGPCAKGSSFQEAYKSQWDRMVSEPPNVLAGSTNKYQTWETVDPEKWVPDGCVGVRIDSRGAGQSPGVLDVWSPRDTRDFYHYVEWAAAKPWSNGHIGLADISYHAMNRYQVAALEPPHLIAIRPWEGAPDFYREMGATAASSRPSPSQVPATGFDRAVWTRGARREEPHDRRIGRRLGKRRESALNIRQVNSSFVECFENEWPLARTQWTKYHLDFNGKALSTSPLKAEQLYQYSALGNGVTLSLPPFAETTEVTGPAMARLFVSSTMTDADLLLVVRLFAPNGAEVTFHGALDPNTPIKQGWLRASHRKFHPAKSLPYRPITRMTNISR